MRLQLNCYSFLPWNITFKYIISFWFYPFILYSLIQYMTYFHSKVKINVNQNKCKTKYNVNQE